MLRMKHTKLIAYIIMAILLMGCFNINLAYADSDVIIKVGDAITNADGTYSVPVSIENNPGLAGVIFKLNYDTNVLQVKNVTPASGLFGAPMINTSNAGTVNYVYVAAANERSSGTIYTVNFKSVSKEACTTELTISDIDLCDSDLKSVTGKGSNNKITVGVGSGNNSSSSDSGNNSSGNSDANTNSSTESNQSGDSNNSTTTDSSSSSKAESTGTEVSTDGNAENAADEPNSASSSDNNSNDNGGNNSISLYIVIGAIVIMCGICAAMGIMWYKAK